jgi:hypothetical protein
VYDALVIGFYEEVDVCEAFVDSKKEAKLNRDDFSPAYIPAIRVPTGK